MYHMRSASVSDLRYRFSIVEEMLRDGNEIAITKRRRVIARLLPVKRAVAARRPDFLGRLRRIYGSKVLKTSGAVLLTQERSRY